MINLQVNKIANQSYLFLNRSNKIRYSVTITNLGDEQACFVRMYDMVTEGGTLIKDSIVINCCKEGILFNNGILTIGCINANDSVTIGYELEVDKECPPKEIRNKVKVTYFDENTNSNVVESNEVVIPIININVCLLKVCNEEKVTVGDVINYSILIRNNSTVDIKNVIFYDDLSKTVVLLPGTVTIDSVPQFVESLDEGLALGDIKSNSSVIVSFDVVVKYLVESILCNVAKVEFNYEVNDYGTSIISDAESFSNCNKVIVLPKEPNCK